MREINKSEVNTSILRSYLGTIKLGQFLEKLFAYRDKQIEDGGKLRVEILDTIATLAEFFNTFEVDKDNEIFKSYWDAYLKAIEVYMTVALARANGEEYVTRYTDARECLINLMGVDESLISAEDVLKSVMSAMGQDLSKTLTPAGLDLILEKLIFEEASNEVEDNEEAEEEEGVAPATILKMQLEAGELDDESEDNEESS